MIVDAKRRILVAMAGRPPGDDWDGSCVGAGEAVNDAKAELVHDPQLPKNRRGTYASINAGVSYGRGQPVSGPPLLP